MGSMASPGKQAITPPAEGAFRTSDGVTLRFLDAGRGSPLLLLPGWSQTAAMYRRQLDTFSATHRVIALDWRGHGASEKAAHGYRVSRFAADLHEFLRGEDLHDVVALGHSMGCAVLWAYWNLFGRERLRALVLVDQPPMHLPLPGWSEEERARAGCVMTEESLAALLAGLLDADADQAAVTRSFLRTMLLPTVSSEELEFLVGENLKLPREAAARLLKDTACADWRDLIPQIDVPTLVVSGAAGHVPLASQEWIRDQIPGAQLAAFGATEGGSHFVFREGAEPFNRALRGFLDSLD